MWQVSVEEKLQTTRIKLKIVRPFIEGVSVAAQSQTPIDVLGDSSAAVSAFFFPFVYLHLLNSGSHLLGFLLSVSSFCCSGIF